MGLQLSKIKERNGVNYHCPECKKTKKTPNLVGKFVLINDHQFKCNGCNSIFDKNNVYSSFSHKNPKKFEHVIKV